MVTDLLPILERIAFILLVNLLFYLRTIRFGYVSDDIDYIQKHVWDKNKWKSLRERFLFGKKVPQVDHSIQIFWHALVCAFIYIAFGANNVSFLAALLFSFNPANNQAAIWLSGRGYLLPALCLLISLSMPILAPIFILATVWFNPAFFAPLALLGSNKAYLAGLLPFCWIFLRKRFVHTVKAKIAKEGFDDDKRLDLSKLIIATKTFGFYLTLCIIPFKIAFYHSFLQSMSGNDIMHKRAYTMKDKFFWFGLVGIGLFIYSLFHWSLISWGYWWFCITILPFLNIRRLQQEIAERYLYLPNVGLMFALAGILINNPISITIFLTMYMVRMWFVMDMYKDDYWIVEYSVAEDKNAWYGWHIRGLKRWDVKSYKEALIMWVMAKMLSPKEFKVLINISTVLKLLNLHKEAEEYLKIAEENMVKGQEEDAKRLIKETREGKSPILI